MKNKKIWAALLSVIAVVAIVVCVIKLKSPATAKADGAIQVVIVDIEGNTLQDKKIEFMQGDDLVTLLSNNFENVDVRDGFLYGIDTLTTPEDWSSYICLYVDDEMSMVGITEVQYQDGTKISFIDTAYSY